MLNLAVRNTSKLIRAKSKSDNVRLGRLFTKKDTARRMASMFSLSADRNAYTVLDPGAGTGILCAAVVERICREIPKCTSVFLSCYENNPLFLPVLTDNLERIRKKCRHDFGVKLFVSINDSNFLTDAPGGFSADTIDVASETYDLIICNPPSDFCDKFSEESLAVGGVTQVKIRSQYLFLKTAVRHLEPNGQLVCVLPTEFISSASLKPFRRSLFSECSLTGAHLFVGAHKNRARAVPLKRNIILAFSRTDAPQAVVVSVSPDAGSDDKTVHLPPLPYGFIVDAEDGSLMLPKSEEDARIVAYFSQFPETMESLQLKMYNGRVLDADCKGLLFDGPLKGTVPLFRPSCIRNGKVEFPQPVPRQYLAATKRKLIQTSKNLIFIKRVPAKGDNRFVNAAVFMASSFPWTTCIATHNKINYIDSAVKGGEMCARLAWGLFALLNSTVYDRYISIVSKSKQINSKEFRRLPLPPRNQIEAVGASLLSMRVPSVQNCDMLVETLLHIRKPNRP